MKEQIDWSMLKGAQAVQLEILLEFDRICRKNNLKYQLYSGTLLGAIRHKGFIPWDDDLDLAMPRKDYERFAEICKEDLSKDYFLQNYNTDKEYPHQFAKLRKNNTLYIEEWFSDIEIHHGVFIDIFPLDNVKPDSLAGNIQLRLLNLMRILNTSRLKGRNLRHIRGINRVFRMAIYYILKILPKGPLDRLNTRLACIFNKEDTDWMGELGLATTREAFGRFLMGKDIFEDSIEWEFEGHFFPIPKNYDEVLTRTYGDYMTPPPIEEQRPHHRIIEFKF